MTGYGLRYQSDFRDLDERPCRLSFYRRGYSGAVTELDAGAEPLLLDYAEDVLFGHWPLKTRIGLHSAAGAELADFAADTDRDWYVEAVEVESSITLFRGWLSPFDAREPFAPAPYPIRLGATDGLGSLKDFPFYDYASGSPYRTTDRPSLTQVLQNCLRWCGYDAPLSIFIRRYETRTVSPDPLSVVYVNPKRWQNDDGTWMDCLAVLNDVLQPFNARLHQQNGGWWVQAMDELTSNPVNLNGVQYGGLATGLFTAGYWDLPVVVRWNQPDGLDTMEGLNTALETATRRHIVTFDYGRPPTQLLNGDFSRLSAGGFPEFWNKEDFSRDLPPLRVGDGSAEDPHRLRIYGNSLTDRRRPDKNVVINVLPEAGQWIRRPNGEQHKWTLSFRFKNFRAAGAKVALWVEDETGTFWVLKPDFQWDTRLQSRTYLEQDNLVRDGTGDGREYWLDNPNEASFSIETAVIPRSERQIGYRIYVRLFRGPKYTRRDSNYQGAYVDYRDVRLELKDQATIQITKEVITAEVAGLTVRDRLKKEELSLRLGDQTTAVAPTNAQPLRSGAMLMADGSPSRRWKFPTPPARPTYHHALQVLCGFGRLMLSQRQRRVVDGALAGEVAPAHLLQVPELANRRYVIVRYQRNVRTGQVQVTAWDVPAYDPAAFKLKTEAGTGDGALLPLPAPTSTEATDIDPLPVPIRRVVGADIPPAMERIVRQVAASNQTSHAVFSDQDLTYNDTRAVFMPMTRARFDDV